MLGIRNGSQASGATITLVALSLEGLHMIALSALPMQVQTLNLSESHTASVENDRNCLCWLESNMRTRARRATKRTSNIKPVFTRPNMRVTITYILALSLPGYLREEKYHRHRQYHGHYLLHPDHDYHRQRQRQHQHRHQMIMIKIVTIIKLYSASSSSSSSQPERSRKTPSSPLTLLVAAALLQHGFLK
jgi:hypothetical protein